MQNPIDVLDRPLGVLCLQEIPAEPTVRPAPQVALTCMSGVSLAGKLCLVPLPHLVPVALYRMVLRDCCYIWLIGMILPGRQDASNANPLITSYDTAKENLRAEFASNCRVVEWWSPRGSPGLSHVTREVREDREDVFLALLNRQR